VLAWIAAVFVGDAAASDPPAPGPELPPSNPELPPPLDLGPADPLDGKQSSVTFNDDFELRYWTSPALIDLPIPNADDLNVFDYIEQVNRLNTFIVAGRWNFTVQLDQVSLWLDRYYLDDQLQLERDLTGDGLPNVFSLFGDGLEDRAYINLEKFRATTEGDWGTATLGDSYVAFGRGLSLNMNRNVDIDVDTSIQGAKFVFRPGAWDLTLVAGQANRQQVFQDNPNATNTAVPVIQGDKRHLVTGFRAERFGLGPANLGAHVVGYDFVQTPGWAASVEELDGFDAIIGGATAELVGVAGFDTYVEGDLFHYRPDLASALGEDAPETGYGLYASTSAYPGPFVVLLEGKRYYQAERVNSVLTSELYEVAIAPTLEYERVITEDSAAALNSSDIWGGRVQVDWAAIPGKMVPSLAFAAFRDLDVGQGLQFSPEPETILHGVAGVEWIDGDFGLLTNVGHRRDQRDGEDGGADRHTHFDMSLNFPIPGKLIGYVSLYAEDFRWGNNLFQQTDYVEVESGWTLSYKGLVSGTVFVDRSTNPLVVEPPEDRDELIPTSRPNFGDYGFLSGEFQVKPARAWTLKAFYGAQKAGIRCAGGQCRQLPSFNGARFSVVGTF
jgi:hypothetical protein